MNKKMLLLAACFLMPAAIFCSNDDKPSARLAEYIDMCVEYSGDDPLDPNMESGMKFHREYKESYDVLYANKKFFSYRAEEFSYTGGAHGGTTVSVGSLRRITGKRITLREIAPTAAQQKKLLNLVTAACAKHFKCSVEKLPEKLLSKPFLTKNFYLNGKGITFVFNEYEIACFAAGTISVFVPYTQYPVKLK